MLRFRRAIDGLLVVVFAPSLFAHGQIWDFLGFTQIDRSEGHGRIQIPRSGRLFRTIQLRVSGEAVFIDRVVVHFGPGASQELIISDRISPEGNNYIIDFAGERALESVEFWYYQEPWRHNPRLSLYGKPSAGLRGRTFSVSSIKREVNKKNNSPRELEFFRFAAQLAIRSTP